MDTANFVQISPVSYIYSLSFSALKQINIPFHRLSVAEDMKPRLSRLVDSLIYSFIHLD